MIFKFARIVAPLAVVLFAISAQAGTQDGADNSDAVTQPDTSAARLDFDRIQQQTGRIPDMDESEAAEKVTLPQRLAKKDKKKGDGDDDAAAGQDTDGSDDTAAKAEQSEGGDDTAATDDSQSDKKAKKAEKGEKKKNKKKSKKKDQNKKDKSEG